MATLKLRIVTPEGVAFEDDVDEVSFISGTGQLGILPHHVPLMTTVAAGEVRARKGSHEFPLAVGRGFAHVERDRLSILTDSALTVEEIDEQSAESAMERARATLATHPTSEEAAEAERALVRAAAQLEFKRRRRSVK